MPTWLLSEERTILKKRFASIDKCADRVLAFQLWIESRESHRVIAECPPPQGS